MALFFAQGITFTDVRERVGGGGGGGGGEDLLSVNTDGMVV